MKKIMKSFMVAGACLAGTMSTQAADPIVRDAEYYLLEAQNAEKWAKDDMAIDKKIEAFMKKNGGKAPNIVYILLDDLGFGEIGMPDMDVVRGYKTPHISKFATEGLSFQRMYTEPSCTPTRVAMMTGRLPVRTGMVEAKATMSGEGLSGKEVLLPEVLLKAGYTTSHVGKWHLGELEQSYANNQGFEHAEFPVHQQGQLAIMHKDSERQHIITGVQRSGAAQTFTLDASFVADPSNMVTGLEQDAEGKLHEVDLKPGEPWTQQKYREMNERYQKNTLKELRRLAKQDKPFFLNYWPLFPLSFVRENREFKTLNGGTVAESIVECDQWIGDILKEIDDLGLAENTIVLVMGDNGPFMQYAGPSGQNDRIYRSGKAQHLEGGVRVNAFMRWKGVIEPGTRAEDIIHVSDLYTTLARLGGAEKHIPRDRIIDGVDQSGVVMLGETYGRRDYVFVYEGTTFKSVVKNKYKMHLPAPGENPIAASIFDLYRDSREERPLDSIQYGPWAGGQFANIAKRHMMRKMKYPDRKPTYGIPYEGIQNLPPETKKMLQLFKAAMMAPKK